MSAASTRGLKRRLYLSFAGIGLSLLLAVGLALVATDRLGDLLDETHSNTLPRILGGTRLSEQGALLAASLPVLVASEDRSTLDQRWGDIERTIGLIREHLSEISPDGVAVGEADEPLSLAVDAYVEVLKSLRGTTAERLTLLGSQREQLAQTRDLHSALTDTISPVVYGVGSLSNLLARRDARRLGNEFKRAAEDHVRALNALQRLHVGLHHWREAGSSDAVALSNLLQEAREELPVADEASFWSGIAERLAQLAIAPGPDPASVAELLEEVENMRSAADAQWRKMLAQMIRHVRQALPERVAESGSQLTHALNIKAEGNLLVAILTSTAEVDELGSLAALRHRFNRSLAAFRAAAEGFSVGPLAQRNPILADNVAELERRLASSARDPNGLFELRRQQLRLAVTIEAQVAQARGIASGLTREIGRIVSGMKREVEVAGVQARWERRLFLGLLLTASLAGLVLSLLIATTTARTLDRDAIALGLAQRETEEANQILEAVGFSARHLLGAASWEQAVPEVLARLGRATETSRVYVFRLSVADSGRLFAGLLYEWCADAAWTTIEDPELRNLDVVEAGFERWIQLLSSGRPVFGRTEAFEPPERAFLEALDVRSVLVAPISVERKLWGILGFEDCERSRDWSEREVEVLNAAADTLGSAIAHDLAQRQIRQAATVFENTKEGGMITDASSRILAVNPAFSEITGFQADRVIGETPRMLASGRQGVEFYRDMWQALAKQGQWQGEILNRRADGSLLPEWLSISAIKDTRGEVVQYVGVFSDITAIKRSEQQLEYLAHHDPLTGLPNRVLLGERLTQAMARARRGSTLVALLFLDLDRFKYINDSLGHDVGDEILMEVSQRLQRTIRAGDTVARLGGDEFVAALEDIRDPQEVERVAELLLRILVQGFRVRDRELYISASIGISFYPEHGETTEELIKNADAAMYRAKEAGRNTYRAYSPMLTVDALTRVSLESALRGALDRGEFRLYYQPQCEATDGRVVALEALLRWRRGDDQAPIGPDSFIPIAEDAGLMIVIGQWVLETACEQCRAWRDLGLEGLRVAVNLSGDQLVRGRLPAVVQQSLQANRLPGDALELEITEGSAMREPELTIGILGEVRKQGVTIAIDDFGTGYSSLGQLKRLPFTTLKIDRSFVDDIPDDPNDKAISLAVIALAHSLQMSVVAEGVESAEQLAFLREAGCDLIQGYLFSRPLPAAAMTELLLSGGTLLPPREGRLLVPLPLSNANKR